MALPHGVPRIGLLLQQQGDALFGLATTCGFVQEACGCCDCRFTGGCRNTVIFVVVIIFVVVYVVVVIFKNKDIRASSAIDDDVNNQSPVCIIFRCGDTR